MGPAVLNSRRDAASVNLQQAHAETSPVATTSIEDPTNQRAGLLRWTPPQQRERDDHANQLKASEDGAEAVAIVTAYRALGYQTVGRAHHGSGSDLLMRRPGAPADDIVRLEVSGIVGKASSTTRLKEKVAELRKGNLKRPGVAMVVAFSESPVRIRLEEVR